MTKKRQNVPGTWQPVVNLGPLAHACNQLAATHTERAAQAITQHTRFAWRLLCDRLLVTRDRHDRAALRFERTLTICHRTLCRLSRQRPGTPFELHAEHAKVYLGLVRRFRREGVPGLTAGISEARASLRTLATSPEKS
jgi:hypothetical protein